MTDYTLLLDQSSCDVTGEKRSPPTTTTDKPLWEVNKKIRHASLFVVRSCGILDAVSVVVRYYTLHEMKQLIVTPVISDRFQNYVTPYIFLVGLLSGWYHVAWPRRNSPCDINIKCHHNRLHHPLCSSSEGAPWAVIESIVKQKKQKSFNNN